MNPMLRLLFGPEAAMLTGGDGRPDNSLSNMTGLAQAYRAARLQNGTPNGRVQRGFSALPPPPPPVAAQAPTPPPAPSPSPGPVSMLGQHMFNPVPPPSNPGLPAWAQAGALPQGSFPGAPSNAQAMAPSPPPPVPMPAPRPMDAPQAPAPMGFFARNTAMMRDPQTGQFLDPAAAQLADASGPDLVQKFMNHFNNKGLS